MSEVQQITKANFIRLGIAAFKEHELREIVATFCKLPGIAPVSSSDVLPCKLCGKPPGQKVGPPAMARCITKECEGSKLGADTLPDWNVRQAASVSQPEVRSEDEVKLTYVKRWRTIVKLPAKYADEIAEALRTSAQAQTGCGDPSCKDPNCEYGK